LKFGPVEQSERGRFVLERSGDNPRFTRNFDMEAERINLIGGKLADLSVRTQALRGYL